MGPHCVEPEGAITGRSYLAGRFVVWCSRLLGNREVRATLPSCPFEFCLGCLKLVPGNKDLSRPFGREIAGLACGLSLILGMTVDGGLAGEEVELSLQ